MRDTVNQDCIKQIPLHFTHVHPYKLIRHQNYDLEQHTWTKPNLMQTANKLDFLSVSRGSWLSHVCYDVQYTYILFLCSDT